MPATPLALRIEIPTWRAAQAAPAFADTLQRHRAGASFLFAFGPDRSGQALNHVFHPECHGRAERSSLFEYFGIAPLFYGLLLPPPKIGRRSAAVLPQLRDSGFEIGVAGWDALEWIRRIDSADAAWSLAQLEQAQHAYQQLLGSHPLLHAAPGWRSNPHALRLTQRLGFSYASDTRGTHPFVPVWHGEIVRCMQIPTTLPTLDELLASIDPASLGEQMLALTADRPRQGHVFSLRLSPAMTTAPALIDALLTGWREQGYELMSVRDLAARFDMDKLPRHEIAVGKVPGRHGKVLIQGDEFLSTRRCTS